MGIRFPFHGHEIFLCGRCCFFSFQRIGCQMVVKIDFLFLPSRWLLYFLSLFLSKLS